MDSCLGVEQDLDKATIKFTALNDHAKKVLEDVINQVEELKKEIAKQPPNTQLSQSQAKIVSDLAASVKQNVFQLSTDHRELHATVSRVGKSIDRHFIADYAAVAPKAETFCSDANRPIMEQAIAQHLYRQGLDEVGDSLVAEAGVTAERGSTFAQLQRCAAALAAGDPAPALAWAAAREHDLAHSPLPFALHRMQALKLAREEGVCAAIAYARAQFPAHAARHERQLQAAVCALAWCSPGAPPPPPHYAHLLDPKALGRGAVRARGVRAAAAGAALAAGGRRAGGRARAARAARHPRQDVAPARAGRLGRRRTAARGGAGRGGRRLPLGVRVPHPAPAGVRAQPAHAPALRTRHLARRAQQARHGRQVEVSLLPHGTVAVRSTTNILLLNIQKYLRHTIFVLILHSNVRCYHRISVRNLQQESKS